VHGWQAVAGLLSSSTVPGWQRAHTRSVVALGALTSTCTRTQFWIAAQRRSVVGVSACRSYWLPLLHTVATVHCRSEVAVGARAWNSVVALQTVNAAQTRSEVSVGARHSLLAGPTHLQTCAVPV
jgi:hypothetical protein